MHSRNAFLFVIFTLTITAILINLLQTQNFVANYRQTSKKHNSWLRVNFFSSCPKKCKDAKGVACGAAELNCCVEGRCVEQSQFGVVTRGQCMERVFVSGCTDELLPTQCIDRCHQQNGIYCSLPRKISLCCRQGCNDGACINNDRINTVPGC